MLNEDQFIDFVSNEAIKIGKLFVIDTGEGNDCIDRATGWYIEDLSGWLIDANEKDNLLIAREKKTAHNDFSEEYVFAQWSRDETGRISISFEKY